MGRSLRGAHGVWLWFWEGATEREKPSIWDDFSRLEFLPNRTNPEPVVYFQDWTPTFIGLTWTPHLCLISRFWRPPETWINTVIHSIYTHRRLYQEQRKTKENTKDGDTPMMYERLSRNWKRLSGSLIKRWSLSEINHWTSELTNVWNILTHVFVSLLTIGPLRDTTHLLQ